VKNVNKFLLASEKLAGEGRRFKSLGISPRKERNFFLCHMQSKRNRIRKNLKIKSKSSSYFFKHLKNSPINYTSVQYI